MKKERLEELLHDKLAHTEVKPPTDMWARLESQLPDIRRELMSGQQAQVPAGDALPSPKIRRPLRRKMQWAYVAASVAVAAVMIFSLNNLDKADMVADDTTGDVSREHVLPITDPVITPGPEEDATQVTATTPAATATGRAIAAATAGRRATTTTGTTVDNTTQGTEDTTMEGGVPAIRDNTPAEGSQRTQGNQTTTRTPARQDVQDKTSDKSRQEEFAAFMARAIADDGVRTRRTRPVAASFFASNTTGVTGDGTVTGRVKLQKSPLVITDITEYPDEESASTTSLSSFDDLSLKHDLPLAFGASVNIGLTNRLSVETGLTYTYMRSKGETLNSGAERIAVQKLHYLGLPVKVKYDFFQSRFVNLYAGAGASIEKLISGKYTYSYYYDGVKTNTTSEKIKVGSLQTSVGANLGVGFNIDKTFGIYVEPGVGYFFENGNQPASYRTEHPFNFTIKAGFRINL